MSSEILAFAIEFMVQAAFLVLALWIMLKIQKLEYNVPGLLGAAALASALDMIPYAGHPLAVGVLLFTMTKVTRSEYVDVAFTVFVGYALMFGMNLFLLGALLGDLRPSARHDDLLEARLEQGGKPADAEAFAPIEGEEKPVAAPVVSAESNRTEVTKQKPSPATGFSLKGLTKNSNNSVAIVSTGTKTYTIGLGETLAMDTPQGKVKVNLATVNDNSVVLRIGEVRTVLSR
jgi:hypothetical protein